MRFRSKINNNYIIKIKRYKGVKTPLYLILIKNKKHINKYLEISFTRYYKNLKQELKYNTYIIQVYDEILKEKYDVEVY